MKPNATEVKKELYKSKANATLKRIIKGTMYYQVQLEDGLYEFPIETLDKVNTTLFKIDPKAEAGLSYVKVEDQYYTPSSDLGTTSFEDVMKASDLNRWIAKAIEKDEFVKIA